MPSSPLCGWNTNTHQNIKLKTDSYKTKLKLCDWLLKGCQYSLQYFYLKDAVLEKLANFLLKFYFHMINNSRHDRQSWRRKCSSSNWSLSASFNQHPCSPCIKTITVTMIFVSNILAIGITKFSPIVATSGRNHTLCLI
jgi:hypothetical protein